MMHALFAALLLPVLLSILLLPSSIYAQNMDPANVQNITYPADVSTCANKAVQLHLVMVQPNCDMAISTLCSSVNASIASNDALINLRAVGDFGYGPCEAQILFRDFEPGPSGYDYQDCVKAFQSITIDCMLISVGKEAVPGKQAGVRAVAFDPAANFTAALTTSPGYLVAQPKYFPQNNTTELDVPGNLPPSKCEIVGDTLSCSAAPVPSGYQEFFVAEARLEQSIRAEPSVPPESLF